jgi:hypothetical protein
MLHDIDPLKNICDVFYQSINGTFLTAGHYLGKSIDCGMEIRWEIIFGGKITDYGKR